jgi:iron(III) transport system substrate-binding protein
LLIGLVGCAPAAPPSPAAAPAQPTAAPAAAQVAAGQTSTDWNGIVEAAKKEGNIVVLGPSGADMRNVLTTEWSKKYPDIKIEFTAGTGSELAPKLLQEREAGLFKTDVYIGGGGTPGTTLKQAKVLDPIRAFLVGPDVQDMSKWLGGKFDFIDIGEEFTISFVAAVGTPLGYNKNLFNPDEVTSFKDLLAPQYKGKYAMNDIRFTGPGNYVGQLIYVTPGLGKEFLTELLKGAAAVSRDDRQIADWVTQGQYPFAVGAAGSTFNQLIPKGVPIAMFEGHRMKEGAYVSSSNGTVSILNKAPHPNAAKVYLNWLLSRDTQLAWSKAVNDVMRRLDVPREHLPPGQIPKDGINYHDPSKEKSNQIRMEVIEVGKSALGQ